MNAFGVSRLILAGLCLSWAVAARAELPALLELKVKTVGFADPAQSPVVILVNKEQTRFLPIWVGANEAQAIAMELHEVRPPRPMTHDLIRTLIAELDGRVERLVISEIRDGTYYGKLSIASQDKTRVLDCRPSDGIAIALRTGAPIFAAESVMENSLPLPAGEAPGQIQTARAPGFGLTVQALTADLADAFGYGGKQGVLVSASERPEVHVGDLIVDVGGAAVENLDQFRDAIERAGAKRPVTIKLLRGDKPLTVRVSPVK
jgi:bifunctional DNase/RNase